MNRRLYALTVLTSFALAVILMVAFVCMTRNEQFGEGCLNFYEDMTNDYGHTVEGLYNRLSQITIIGILVLFLMNQIIGFALIERLYEHKARARKVKAAKKRIYKKSESKHRRSFHMKKLNFNLFKKKAKKAADTTVNAVDKANQAVSDAAKKVETKSNSVDDFINQLKNK